MSVFIFMMTVASLSAQSSFNKLYQNYLAGERNKVDTIEDMISHLKSYDHQNENEFTKCLTPLMILLESEKESLNDEFLQKLNEVSPRTNSSVAEFISPSGKFRIHYETSGSHAVPSEDINSNGIPDYVEEVAEASDSSYNHEILNLGFTDPIGDGEVYDIFIENLSSLGAYGLTNNRSTGSFPCNTSNPETCIYIENDFIGYPPNTDPEGEIIGSIKVTIAHELKHAVQFAQNGWRGDSDLWAEMDATLMEEVVYDNVNDYYNYINGFSSDLFNSPASSLTSGSYEDVTWALYFHERFGEKFWPNVWGIIESNDQISMVGAIENELILREVSYDFSVLESYLWHFASGDEFASINYGFDERFEYPNPSLSATYLELQSALTDTLSLNPFSARYFATDLIEPTDGFVKLDFEVSSDDVHLGLLGYFSDGTLETQTAIGNSNRLTGSIETNWAWGNVENVGLVVMNSNPDANGLYSFQFTKYFIAEEIELAQNFPNPFNPSTTIRLSIPQNQEVKLEIFDLLGRKIQTVYNGFVQAGFRDFVIDATTLSTGVYIYRLTSDFGIQTKAMTLIK